MGDPRSPRPPKPTYGIERLGALSDGVFAIVLTLLVLDLRVPDSLGGGGLAHALESQGASFIAWVVSFVVISRFWIVHHAVTATLERCHTATLGWNLLVMGALSLVPFGTSVIGAYEFDPLAVVVFSLVLGATGVSLGIFARHAATEAHLQRPGDVPDLEWHWKYHVIVYPLFAAAALAVLPFYEPAALAVWIIEPAVAFASARRRAV